jgi:hypothetical protein
VVAIALGVSIAVNIGLLCYLALTHGKLGKAGPKPLPKGKPDFEKIEDALREELAAPETHGLFELLSFEAREWLCHVELRDKFKDQTKETWGKLESIVRRVSSRCGVPGRTAGWVCDSRDPRRLVGHSLQFGYSLEVGYARENEFSREQKGWST